ncbi:GGDEF domain-containing protein [Sphingomicrobium sp. XHP0235]|uniref:GGDEF domain-containing protein n=1 Tax=Sphingomicrobium aquimarinum TaxID=3133971 RepID=UPI0031FE7D68
MDFSVNLYGVMAMMIVILMGVALLLRATLLSGRAPLFLAVGLGVGALSTWMFVVVPPHPLSIAYFAVADPLAVFCVAQATRIAFGKAVASRRLTMAIAGIASLSIIAAFLPIAPPLQTLPLGIATCLVIADAMLVLWRCGPGLVSRITFFAWSIFMVTSVVRIPGFPGLLGAGAAYPDYANPAMQWFLLLANSVVVPAIVFAIIGRLIANRIAELRAISARDSMTGLLNRSAFEDAMRSAERQTGTLVLADLDHFKQVNDRYGHAVGDEVLCEFARRCAAQGIAGRLGGEEFAIALPSATLFEARAIAERLREGFAAWRHPALDDDHRLSASFGLAAYQRGEGFAAILRRADDALYAAKNRGRDRVIIHGPAMTPMGAVRA